MTRSSPSSPVTRALTRAGRDCLAAGAEGPLPVSSTPGGAAIGRRCHQLRHRPSSLWVDPSVDDPSPACSAAPEPDELAADVPCRTPDMTRRSVTARRAPRTPPLAARQRYAVDEPGTPSTDRSPGRAQLSLDLRRQLSPLPRFAAGARRPTPFHAHAVCARRAATRLFAACRRAKCRRSTSAIRRIREHTRGPPKHRRWKTANRHGVDQRHPEGHHRPDFQQARGRAPFGRAIGTHPSDRSPWWIYPNLIDPNTRVAIPCSSWRGCPRGAPLR